MAGLSITFSDISSSGSNNNTYNVTANLYISGNGVSHNGENPPYWIWVGNWATTTQWIQGNANFSTSTSAQYLGSLSMRFDKAQSKQTVTINGQYNTDTQDFGNLLVSKSLDIPAGNFTYNIEYYDDSTKKKTQTVTSGSDFTISPPSVSKTGYAVTGWIDPTGADWNNFSGKWVYANGAWGITNNTLKLSAQWTPTYTITYYGNNNTSGTMSPTTNIISGSTAQLRQNTFSRTGYGFIGWSTSPNSETAMYSDKASITVNKNIDLYAVWTDVYTAPVISNAQIIRCFSNGTENIAGDYIKINFEWQAASSGSSGYSQSMTYSITAPFNVDSQSLDNTSSGGTVTTVPIAYPLGNTESVILTLADNSTNGESVSQTLNIPEGGLTMHINENGLGVRFFGIAKDTDNGLYIKDINVGNWLKAPYIKEMNSGIDTFYIAEQDSTIGTIKMGIGTTRGGRRGIWDYNSGKWLINRDGSDLHNGKTTILCGSVSRELILADQIIDYNEKTEGNINWRWRKYASGIAECWGYISLASQKANTAWGSVYYEGGITPKTVTLPSGLFVHVRDVQATIYAGQGFWGVNLANWSATNITYWIYSYNSETRSVGVSFHVYGRWKSVT